MRSIVPSLLVALAAVAVTPAHAAQPDSTPAPLRDPKFLEAAKAYSDRVVAERPYIRALLERLGYDYLHQLDPDKVYSINRSTLAVTVRDAAQAPQSAPGASASPNALFGFMSAVNQISASGSDILGLAKTVVTCPFGAQTADVLGFMASTVSRDPVAGLRHGTITKDDFLDTVSQLNLRILKATGGAKNPINRTAMETTHSGTCGSDAMVRNVVATWPPLRLGMVIDDTGSMSEELGGVKTALAEFIGSVNADPARPQRGVSYDLVSFKDSPSLRLDNTTDTAAAIGAVNGLFASGGGDCPEDSLGALALELSRLSTDDNSDGEIVLVTDASPGPGSADGVIAQARALGVRVNVMLSGDCVATAAASTRMLAAQAAIPSARAVFERIAKETGGLYFYRPGGTVDDYREILSQIFESALTGGDTTPPVVSVTASPTLLWPPNHRMVRIDTGVSATDDKDPAPAVRLLGVTVNEPDDGQGDGHTANDVVVNGAGQIYLRAERSGSGQGRFYTITYEATDSSGNKGIGSVDVVVPHEAPR